MVIHEFTFMFKFWRYLLRIDPIPNGYRLLRYKGAQSQYRVQIEKTVYAMTNWRNYGLVPESHAIKLM